MNFLTRKAIPRRALLRGALALPLLDAMVPAATAWAHTPARPVRRLGFVFIPMGCDQDRWTPPEMSLAFLGRLAAPTRHVPLEGCGHFPVEEPGLTRAVEVLREVLEALVPQAGGEVRTG